MTNKWSFCQCEFLYSVPGTIFFNVWFPPSVWFFRLSTSWRKFNEGVQIKMNKLNGASNLSAMMWWLPLFILSLQLLSLLLLLLFLWYCFNLKKLPAPVAWGVIPAVGRALFGWIKQLLEVVLGINQGYSNHGLPNSQEAGTWKMVTPPTSSSMNCF